ncbi:putative flagellar protein FlgO, partial [Vibrio parahaemolyticus V-223/04]
SSKFSMC